MKKIKDYYLISLLISVPLFLLICFQYEADFFWHVKAGEYMLHHGILTHDIYSWSVVGKYWMSHEWLFEILLAGLRSIFGNVSVFLYCYIFILALFCICFLPNRKCFIKNIPFSLLYFALFSILLAPFVQARPHLISFCLLALSIWILYDSYHHESKKIWFLPILSLIWANVHGGSSNLIYLLCFLFGVAGSFSFQFKKIEAKRISKKQIRIYFIVMILCMIIVNINPHGFKMFLYPYQNMMNTTMIHNIAEWRSTSLSEPVHYLFFGFVLFLVMILLFSDKKIQWIDFLLLGFSTYLGLKSIRFWLFCPIIMSFSIYDYVKYRKMDRGTTLAFASISLFLIAVFIGNVSKMINTPVRKFLPDDIYSVLKNEKPERLFHKYDFGGELIYHNIPVFIDGRADYYSPYNFDDYIILLTFNGDYVSLMKKYDFDYYLISSKMPLYIYLKNDDTYSEIYHKKDIILFKKNS